MENINEIIEILEKDARITAGEIAVMIGKTEEEVVKSLKEMEDNKVILGYKPLINWDKVNRESVSAMIELRVTPQKGLGFDAIAEQINRYPQVKSLHLMSGAYDLSVLVEGKNIKEVAMFVSKELSQIEGVLSTATHFRLKTYKYEGVIYDDSGKDIREVITL